MFRYIIVVFVPLSMTYDHSFIYIEIDIDKIHQRLKACAKFAFGFCFCCFCFEDFLYNSPQVCFKTYSFFYIIHKYVNIKKEKFKTKTHKPKLKSKKYLLCFIERKKQK